MQNSKKIAPIVVIIVILVAVVIFAIIGVNRDTTVVSPDTRITIDIPKSALPDGVSREDITFTNITVEKKQEYDDVESNNLHVAYRATPTDLVFLEPVTMQWKYIPGGFSTSTPEIYQKNGESMAKLSVIDIIDNNDQTSTMLISIDRLGEFIEIEPFFMDENPTEE